MAQARVWDTEKKEVVSKVMHPDGNIARGLKWFPDAGLILSVHDEGSLVPSPSLQNPIP